MILLDTNVLSELMRPAPNETVLAWLDRHTGEGVFVSAITEAEILRGIALLPDGKRRAVLAEIADTLFAEDFADHRLPFDSPSARSYAELAAHRTRTGRPISVEDGPDRRHRPPSRTHAGDPQHPRFRRHRRIDRGESVVG